MEGKIVRNTSLFTGTFNGLPLDVHSTIAETEIIDGIVATKAADKEIWSNGPLTYTITITNNSGKSFENPIFTDTLDISLIDLDQDTVRVNDAATVFTYINGVLSITLPTIPDGGTSTITFQVVQI